MASRLFYRGSCVGTDVEIMVANQVDDEHSYDSLMESFRSFMTEELEKLDSRLWWQPETSEVFWEDDGSGNPLPEKFDCYDCFEDWWENKCDAWFSTLA